MRLRNKKTGEIREGYIVLNLQNDNKFPNPIEGCTTTIAELNKDWEDYEPVEPLIESPKSRKVFREWADLVGAKRFRVDHLCSFCRTVIASNDLVEEPAIELPGFIGKDSETYTREELCGEEE